VRTTVNLEPDVLRAAKSIARERGISLGQAISELIRQALQPPPRTTYEAGFPVFEVREGAPPITNERAVGEARTPAEAIALLVRIRGLSGHVFWTDDGSPADADARAFDGLVGRRQVTDAHLLTLARKRGGRLATLDRGVIELASDDPSSGHAHPVSPGAR
jgi:hypothetical protein